MKNIFTLRSLLSWLILLIAMSALVAGIKEGVRGVEKAAFFPVAAFAVTLAYVTGFSKWSARRAWIIILLSGILFAFIEAAKLVQPIQVILKSIPPFEWELVRWVFRGENVEILFPDTSIFQLQYAQVISRAAKLISLIFSASVQQPPVRELIWDIPILLLSAWAGWAVSRRNQALFALAPALILHTYILQYTGKDIFSLLFGVFALLVLVGVNQRWNVISEKTENSKKTVTETYSAILILSIGLTIIAGLMPSISINEVTKRLVRKDDLGKALGLDRKVEQIYVNSGSSGLPLQHLIGLSPTLSESIVFTVKTGELEPTENEILRAPVPRHYWRWLTYDVYNGQGWETSPVESTAYLSNESLFRFPAQRYKIIHQQVEKAFAQDNRLYWTGSLLEANQPFNANWRVTPRSISPSIDPLLLTDMLGALTKTQTYQANSLLPIISANQLRNSFQVYPKEIREKYLLLPDTVPQRVLDLASSVTKGMTNPYDKTKALEAYLRSYPYSLDVSPPPPDQDVADYFLFDLKTGYCDYYATSMVVMARALGLPARLVIGYANGVYDPIRAAYYVREADAHSWVEIYFGGVGWVEFEPTASKLEFTLPDEVPQENSSEIIPYPLFDGRQFREYTKGGFFPQFDFSPIISGLVFIILFSSAWFLNAQGLLRAHKTVGSIYKYIYYHGRKIYKDAPRNETPSIFADKLITRLRTGYPWLIPALDEMRYLTSLYLQETYSAHPITKDEQKNAVKIWRKLFWRLLYARIIRL